MDVPAANAYTPPLPGWARIELEPVDVPLEQDDSILLSTIQSLIPGAHGLYYKDGDCKKALRYDGSTGRISKGAPGWNTKPLYVVLAHGCHHYGTSAAQYENATERFERTVNLVQRMLGGSDRSGPRGYPYTQEKVNGSEAIDEEWKQKNEDVERQLADERARIAELEKAREQLEWSLGEHKQWLCDAQTRIGDLEKLLDEEKNNAQTLANLNVELNLKLEQLSLGQQTAVEHDQLPQLREELTAKQGEIDALTSRANDAEWSLGEHKQWLMDANTRANHLDELCHEKDRIIEDLTSRLRDVERRLAEIANVDELSTVIDGLRKEMDSKEESVRQLEKAKNDAEWSLGEHRQWLQDANYRIRELQEACAQKDANYENTLHALNENIAKLQKRNDELMEEMRQRQEAYEVMRSEMEERSLSAPPEDDMMMKETLRLQARIDELLEELSRVNEGKKNTDRENEELKKAVDDLHNGLADKEAQLERLAKQKDDAEWCLGEHKQWLYDAKHRISDLEDITRQLADEKNAALVKLNEEQSFGKEELERQILEKDQHLSEFEMKLNNKEQEIGSLKSTVEGLLEEIEGQKRNAADIERQKNDAEWSLGEHRQWLADANSRISLLEEEAREKDRTIDELNKNIDNLVRDAESRDEVYIQLEEASREMSASAEPKENGAEKTILEQMSEELKAKVNELQKAVDDKDRYINELEQQRNDVEWSLGEHKAWLQGANSRITELENTTRDKDLEIEVLRHEIDELSKKSQEAARPEHEQESWESLKARLFEAEEALAAAPKEVEINLLRAELEGLQKELDAKNHCLNALEKARNDTEWSLGEHKQWLADANKRASELDGACQEKEHAIQDLERKLREVEQRGIEEGDARNVMDELHATINGLHKELSEKDSYIGNLEKMRSDMEQSLKEHHQWLEDANSRVQELNEQLKQSGGDSEALRIEVDKMTADVKIAIEGLRKELEEKNDYISQLTKQRNDAEWSLGEHRQWLSDTRSWAQSLENDLEVKNRMVEDLRITLENAEKAIAEAETASKEKIDILEKKLVKFEQGASESIRPQEAISGSVDSTIASLRCQLDDKENELHILQKQKDDAEWRLGEHHQWLQDANYRAAGLENDLEEKRVYIDKLQSELERVKRDSEEANLANQETVNNLTEKLEHFEELMREAPKSSDIREFEERLDNAFRELEVRGNRIEELEKAKNDAEWSLGEHRQWLADANNRVSSLDNELKAASEAIGELKRQVREADTQADELRRDNNALKEKLEQVEQGCIHPSSEIENMRREINAKQEVIVNLEKQRNDLEWSLGEHRQWLVDANNRASSLENELKNTRDFTGELERRIREADALADELRHDNDALREKLEQVERENEATAKSLDLEHLRSEIENMGREMNAKQEFIVNLEKQRNDLEWSLGEHRQWLADTNNWARSLENELKSTRDAIGELERRIREADALADELRHENDALKEKLEQVERENEASAKSLDLDFLRDEIENVKKELEAKTEQVRNLETRLGDTEKYLDENRQQLCDAINRADSFESLVNEKNDVIDDLSKQIWEKDGQIDKLQKEVEGLQADRVEPGEPHLRAEQFCMDETAPILQENVDEMKGKLSRYEKLTSEELKPINAEVQQLQNKVEEDEKQIDALRKEIERLVADINSMSETVSALQKQISDKEDQLANMEKARNDAQWSLGEHIQWLADANYRVGELLNALTEKDELLEKLNRDIDQMARAADSEKQTYQETLNKLQAKDELEVKQKEEDIKAREATIDSLRNEITEKQKYIETVVKDQNDAERSLGEHRQWLLDANNRIVELEISGKEKDEKVRTLQVEMEKLSGKVVLDLKAALEAVQQKEKPEASVEQLLAQLHEAEQTLAERSKADDFVDLKAENDELRKELNDKQVYIDSLVKHKNDAEWSLGEHRQWLQEASDRIRNMEETLRGRQEEVAVLKTEIDELLADRRAAKESMERLEKELCVERERTGLIQKQKEEAEWSLGEHRQWLQDANNRVAALEVSNSDKEDVINDLRQKLNSTRPEDGPQGEEKRDDLEGEEKPLAEVQEDDRLGHLKCRLSDLDSVLREKEDYIANLEKERNDKEWSLGEHRQWLSDANNTIVGLKNELEKRNEEKDAMSKAFESERLHLQEKVDELAAKLRENEEMLDLVRGLHSEEPVAGPEEAEKSKLFAKIFELEEKLQATERTIADTECPLKREYEESIAQLRKELDQKCADLEHVDKDRCNAEWYLGEERQRLKDANARIEELLNCLNAKEEALTAALQRNDELRTMLEETERKMTDMTQSSVEKAKCAGEARIAELEDELMRAKKDQEETLQRLKNAAVELREKNTKLEETLQRKEVILMNLKKDPKTSMLILEQTIGSDSLEEEIRKLREKYAQLSIVLVNTEELLGKLQSEAPEFTDGTALRKTIDQLNEELHQRSVEKEALIKEKADVEWQLGEHHHWLQIANDRIASLEGELARLKESDERILQDLRLENEGLRQKNSQIRNEYNVLKEELHALRRSLEGREEERDICPRCKEDSEFSFAGSVGEDLSALNRSIQELRKELNYQAIIDTLTNQCSSVERSLEEQKQSLTNAYNRIAELELQISANVPEEQPEVIEIRTDVKKLLEESEKVSHLDSGLENAIDLENQLDQLKQHLNDKCVEVQNLEQLNSEIKKNLEEARNRVEVMSASVQEKQRVADAISNERDAIAWERDMLKQQVDTLEQQLRALSTGGNGSQGVPDTDNETRELQVKLHEKEGQLQQIRSEMTEKDEEITNLHAVIQELRNEINEKNRIIDDLNRITSEKEWSLGEHRQWLADANNKANNLEAELISLRASSNQAELDWLRSELDEKKAKITELHRKVADLESEAFNVQYQREVTPKEEEFVTLQEKLASTEEYVQFLKEQLERMKQEHAQQLAEQSSTTPTSPSARSSGFDTSVMSEDYNDLSSELIMLNRRKYKLEEKMKQLETELQAARDRVTWLEEEQRGTGQEIWLAKERVANQDRELGDLHQHCSWLQGENDRLQKQLEEERKRYAETGGVDWSKFDELKGQMKQMEDRLRDEKSKVEWRLGEVTQFWNDAKWKIGELEAGMAHKQWLLDQANQKICELDQMYRFRDTTRDSLSGAFLIRKQPTGDRYKWRLAMWNENSPDDLKDYRRIWFEITAPTANIVLLCASFVNWECFLQCQKCDDTGKFGVWVDIPPGRYEFVYVVDGKWITSDNYPTCYNEHGTLNNWKQVD